VTLLPRPAVLIWFGLLVGRPASLVSQQPDSAHALRTLVNGLPASAQIRISSSGRLWTGRVAVRESDSLTITDEAGTRTIRLTAIDTLWVRRQTHTGLLTGSAFGALMFGLLQIGPQSGYEERLGAILFLGAAGAGMLIDASSPPWTQHHPD
jgi:hypothetical protein